MKEKIKEIERIIAQIKLMTGLDFEYDERFMDDEENFDDEILLFANDELCITINSDFMTASIFISFPYYDFNQSDIKAGCYFEDDLNADQEMLLREKSFYYFLMANSVNYPVAIWDDGSYMCPGYVSRIGFSNFQIVDAVFKEFIAIYLDYLKKFNRLTTKQLQKYIIINFFTQNGHEIIEKNGALELCSSEVIIFDCVSILPQGNVTENYFGSEKFICKVNNLQYYTNVEAIKTFVDFVSFCEILDAVSYTIIDEELQIRSLHFLFKTKIYKDDNLIASQVEEMPLFFKLLDLSHFTGQIKKGIYENIAFLMKEGSSGGVPMIVTEGYTDWMHLKKWWKVLKNDYKNLDIAFWEYYPTNSKIDNVIKQDMGDAVLVEMCKAYSKMSLGRSFIFIADRDNLKVTKELSESGSPYKSWGNGVYSIVIPVPEHRNDETEICIEHFYSDAEIMAKYQCKDGVQRRLYIGKEFDQFGRGLSGEFLCTKRNFCGKESNKIIDGSADGKVLSMQPSDNTNYALPKRLFVESNYPMKGDTYNAFKKIFDIIYAISQDIKKNN